MTAPLRPLYQSGDKARELEELAPEPYRSEWRRDFARLVHSPAFRRLQGKTQLFPGENDFFRNRLTHSLEVAQVAKSIAIRLNSLTPELADQTGDFQVSTDLVEFAALAHDLGHPPFGHNGEAALDECMASYGGFEGNAQTLRIISKIEKKKTKNFPDEFSCGRDIRCGLNVTYRSLASILKYDKQIGDKTPDEGVTKGYYSTESDLVHRMKQAIVGKTIDDKAIRLKTIECQIMDLADDIAYSTYDLEDALKAGFMSLLEFCNIAEQEELLTSIAIKVWASMNDREDRATIDSIAPEVIKVIYKEKDAVVDIILSMVAGILPDWDNIGLPELPRGKAGEQAKLFFALSTAYRSARESQQNGYFRTNLTSDLVGEAIDATSLDYNSEMPFFSKLKIEDSARRKIEVLKHVTYAVQISAPRLKTVEYRGKEIVREIFTRLDADRRHQLLPHDWKERCDAVIDNERERKRNICDFVAGMTDRYALEFYDKLKSTNGTNIFKEL